MSVRVGPLASTSPPHRSWRRAGRSPRRPTTTEGVLRVCADPNNLPLSHRNLEGYENKIAALLAQELGWKLEYTWFPQRMGFIRNTLRGREAGGDRFKCDLVIGVPVPFELAATTRPYYRSTYVMVFSKGKGLDSIAVPEDLLKLDPGQLRKLRFGVFGQTPPADWLLKHGLMEQAVSFAPQSGDPDAYPGELIEKELASGRIDVAFAWGPIAGYYAQRARSPEMSAVPFLPEHRDPIRLPRSRWACASARRNGANGSTA